MSSRCLSGPLGPACNWTKEGPVRLALQTIMGQPAPEGEVVYTTEWGQRLRADYARLARLRVALLFAVSDRLQVAAACDALDALDDPDGADLHLARVLETGLVVAYGRAFTEGVGNVGGTFAPLKGTPELELHDTLLNLRRKVYAHTDEESGRAIAKHDVQFEGDVAHTSWSETAHTLEPELREPIRALASAQGKRLELEAARIMVAMEKWKRGDLGAGA